MAIDERLDHSNIDANAMTFLRCAKKNFLHYFNVFNINTQSEPHPLA